MDAMYTGTQIAQRRKALGLTQKALAAKLNVTDKAVSKWERGINFPDLGLMEALAEALETTPACLLGLEQADQEEILTSLAELSGEQVENAKRDIRITGWCCILTAILLALVYNWIPRQTVQAYQMLSFIMTAAVCAGWYVLVKYRDIKEWELLDIPYFLGGLCPVLIFLFIQLVTGRNPHPLFGLVLICCAACCTQHFFCRMLRAQWAKMIPLILTAGFAGFQLWIGNSVIENILPAICCLITWGHWYLRHIGRIKPTPKAIRTVLCVVPVLVMLCAFLFYRPLVRIFVRGNHENLERYAQSALTQGDADSYGFWSVHAYPEQGMVQFNTGGSGLAPATTYEGFYYSAGDVHIPFQGWDLEMDIQGDTAYWYEDPETSDNWGRSTRIMENWYWFEAHF